MFRRKLVPGYLNFFHESSHVSPINIHSKEKEIDEIDVQFIQKDGRLGYFSVGKYFRSIVNNFERKFDVSDD